MLHDKMTKEELLTLALFDNGGIDDTDLYRDTTDSTYESVKTLSNCGAFPMLSLTAEINAVQDLHGYDHPWAGGANYNKCPEEWKAFGTTTISSVDNFDVQPETEYYFCSPVASQIYYRDADGNNISGITNPQVIGSNTTFTTPSGCYKILLVLQNYGTTYNYDVAVNYPSSITTYSPYSNICPISGWDSIDVCQSGFNVWDEEWEAGGLNDANGTETTNINYVRSGYIPFKGGLSIYGYSSDARQVVVYLYDYDKSYIGFRVITNTAYTLPNNTAFFRIRINNTRGEVSELTKGIVSINYPSTDTEYHAYSGQTYTTALSTTCYGGSKDIKGNERFTHGHIASYNGETLPSTWISDRDEYAEGTTPTIGAEVVYELATPTTATSDAIDLTLAEGVNNIWANSGDVGDARYFKKVEL